MEKNLFRELMGSIREAGRIARGEAKPSRIHLYSAERVRQIRQRFKPLQILKLRRHLKMSQAEFANVMLISRATLQSWEQGRRHPEGPALVLIEVMKKNPRAVVGALHA
jgi:putative transcriptional regulator